MRKICRLFKRCRMRSKPFETLRLSGLLSFPVPAVGHSLLETISSGAPKMLIRFETSKKSVRMRLIILNSSCDNLQLPQSMAARLAATRESEVVIPVFVFDSELEMPSSKLRS